MPMAPDAAVVGDEPEVDDSDGAVYSPYATFSREEWAALSGKIPVPLTEEELVRLQGINEEIS
ncbi:MAG TPA: hypothetical protein VFZ18_11730, partial [Longimicrobiaceae bacterium]